MANNILHVWLRGEHCAELEQLRTGKLRLRFDPEFVEEHGMGIPSLSLSLPNTAKRLEGPHVERFFDNLLPEDPLRATLEREHRIRPRDSFALLKEIGLDCAGAIQFTEHTNADLTGSYRRLSASELSDLVLKTPTIDTPDGLPLSASLGGVQPKLLLWRSADNWSWPVAGAPSNIIVKPDPSNTPIPGLLELEHWTLKLAQLSGVPAADTSLADFAGRRALLVDRFDRLDFASAETAARSGDDASLRCQRVHQEDFAQALGISVAEKYEPSNSTGPSRLASLVQAATPFAESRFVQGLIEQLVFNLVVGNGDAHSKNYSLVLSDQGDISLAPLYDAAPVYLASSRFHGFGHVVAGQSSLRYITAGHLLREVKSWSAGQSANGGVLGGKSRAHGEESAREIIASVCARIASATTDPQLPIVSARTESGVSYPDAVAERAVRFMAGLEALPN